MERKEFRNIQPFEFENWAVIALGGIRNKVQVGDIGMDGHIYPIFSSATTRKKQEGELALKERWYPKPPDDATFSTDRISPRRKPGS